MQTAAATILKRGVELDHNKKYEESLICYQEGIQLLINTLRSVNGEKATYMRQKIEEYMNRAEKIKTLVENIKQQGKYHEQIHIADTASGYSYERVFGRFFEEDITYVIIEDAFIRMFHQIQNLTRFCELCVKKSPNLKCIKLITKPDPGDQKLWLGQVMQSLKNLNISFIYDFSETIHDRQITLSNGWILKIGRGLDYFKAPDNKFGIGAFDMDLRKCHETTIDIFHNKAVKHV